MWIISYGRSPSDADFTVWAQDLHLRAGALTEYDVLEHRSAYSRLLAGYKPANNHFCNGNGY